MNWFLSPLAAGIRQTSLRFVRSLPAVALVALLPLQASGEQAARPVPAARAQAEQTVADAPWFEREIGQGVFWRHYQFENLYGARQSVSVIEADLSRPGIEVSLPFLAAGRGRTSEFVPEQRPDAIAAVNGTYFDTGGPGGATTFLRINDEIITTASQKFGYYGVEAAITIDSEGRVRVERQPDEGWNDFTARRDVMANGPLLLADGKTTDLTPVGVHCSARHPRTAVGMTGAGHLLLASSRRA